MYKIFKIYEKFPNKLKFLSFIFIILTILSTILEVISISMIMPLVSLMLNNNELTNQNNLYEIIFLLKNFFNIELNIKNVIFLFSIIFIFKIIFNIYFVYFQESYAVKIYQFISNSMLKIYLLKDWDFYLQNNSAYLQRNVLGLSNSLRSNVFLPLMRIFSELAILIGITFLLMFVQLKLTLILITVLVSFGLIYQFLTKKFFVNIGINFNEQAGLLIKEINSIFSLFREIKIQKKEKNFFNFFTVINKKFSRNAKIYASTHIIPRSLVEIILISTICSLMLFGEDSKDYKNLFPLIALYLGAGYKLLPGFIKIVNSIRGFYFSEASLKIFHKEFSYKKLNETFKSINEKQSLFNNNIQFKNVNFKYENRDQYVFKNFNFKIFKNEIIGLKGESGRGKTTLINIVMGLIRPTGGEILADEKNIHDNLDQWQSNLGIVQQDNVLIDDTIKNNITLRFHDEKFDQSKLLSSIKNSNLETFLKSLPNGINTIIGEKGAQISGGQRQRICIARMLYNEPEIIILDEATSGLDTKNEESILKFIKNLKGKKTIILVSHSTEALSICDRVIDLNQI